MPACATRGCPSIHFEAGVWANVVSGGLAIWLLTGAELALILALGILVLVMELMNTAIERAVDLVSLERSELARMAKDAGSAGVMVSAIAAGVAWVAVLVGVKIVMRRLSQTPH